MDDEKVEKLIQIAEEAIELAEEGIGYTPIYFRDKWHMDRELNNLKARLAQIKQ